MMTSLQESVAAGSEVSPSARRGRRGRWSLRMGAVLLLLGAAACEAEPKGTSLGVASAGRASASPLPIPYAESPTVETAAPPQVAGQVGIPADSAGRLIVREPEPPAPTPLGPLEHLAPDAPAPEMSVGMTLSVLWRWPEVSLELKGAGRQRKPMEQARDSAAMRAVVDLSYAGRLRVQLLGPAFPLPAFSEVRARSDRYGHVLLWPDGLMYRALPPGSVRSVFGEQRADVMPLSRPTLGKPRPDRRLGLHTEQLGVSTARGKIELEQAVVEGSADAGALLCRFLLELISAEPSSPACQRERIPVHARFLWAEGGELRFEVESVTTRADLLAGQFLVPPAGARSLGSDLPPRTAGVFLDRQQLTSFRSGAQHRDGRPPPDAPGEGVLAVNGTDSLLYLLLDGVPVAWVRPRSTRYLIGTQEGRYQVTWVDFYGRRSEPSSMVQLPARITIGEVPGDAGSR